MWGGGKLYGRRKSSQRYSILMVEKPTDNSLLFCTPLGGKKNSERLYTIILEYYKASKIKTVQFWYRNINIAR